MELNEEWKGKTSERHMMNNEEEYENDDEMEWDINGLQVNVLTQAYR